MTKPDRRVNEAVLREAGGILAAGGSTEDVLVVLKDGGANAIASIRALEQLLGVTTAEAQQLLYDSEAWRGMR